MSGCLMSEPFECTLISSLPPVAFFTSSTNSRTLRVWNSPSEYGVGMSHFVCACALKLKLAKAAAATRLVRIRIAAPLDWIAT